MARVCDLTPLFQIHPFVNVVEETTRCTHFPVFIYLFLIGIDFYMRVVLVVVPAIERSSVVN
jgi:hypothetical protein